MRKEVIFLSVVKYKKNEWGKNPIHYQNMQNKDFGEHYPIR